RFSPVRADSGPRASAGNSLSNGRQVLSSVRPPMSGCAAKSSLVSHAALAPSLESFLVGPVSRRSRESACSWVSLQIGEVSCGLQLTVCLNKKRHLRKINRFWGRYSEATALIRKTLTHQCFLADKRHL